MNWLAVTYLAGVPGFVYFAFWIPSIVWSKDRTAAVLTCLMLLTGAVTTLNRGLDLL